jgi:hypothetical protein
MSIPTDQAVAYIVQFVNDALATLPLSARVPTANHAQQCLASIQAALAATASAEKVASAGAPQTDEVHPTRGD